MRVIQTNTEHDILIKVKTNRHLKEYQKKHQDQYKKGL